MINEEEETRLRAVIHAVLDERAVIDHDTHRRHHDYIEDEIARRGRWEKRREQVLQHVLGWGALLGVGTLGKAIYEYFKNHS